MEECCNCGCELDDDQVIWDEDGNPWCEDCAEEYGLLGCDSIIRRAA